MATPVVVTTPDFEDLMTADLLDFILKKIISVTDYIRFGAVCRIWRWVALQQKEYRRTTHSSYRHHPPLLILPYDNSGPLQRKLYNFSDNKIYSDRISIPVAYGNRQFYSGSFFGWLAFAEHDLSITLINPWGNAPTIHLPPVMLVPAKYYDISTPECFIYKVFISSDPLLHPLNYVVAVIFDDERYGAFIRSGEKSWTGIDKSFMDITDILFTNGNLLAIDVKRQLISIDYNCGALETSVAEEEHILTADIAVMKYLVGGGSGGDFFKYSDVSYILDMGNGEVLHAYRHLLRDEDDELDERLLTEWFKLYKLQNSTWVEIQSIGNSVLFLGTNTSIFTASTPYLRPNCIYYTDDLIARWPHELQTPDMGVFNIETKTIDKLCLLPPDYPTCYRPPPIWISPTF